MNSVKNILSVKNIVKTYPGVIAINDVSFDVEEGEIHALIGENGAGKSTLIKVLSGAIVPDSGTIELEGKQYNQMTPKLAKDLGIEVIYQEFTLVPGISAAENVFLGDKTKPGAFCDIKDREARAKKIFDDLQVDIDVSRPVKTMSPAHQQLVEIAKAVSRNVKILIMDEPTAPLTVSEVETLFRIVRELKAKGVTIIFISHKIREVMQICDNITVLRAGRTVGSIPVANATEEDISRFMVGRDVILKMNKKPAEFGDTLLKVTDLTYENKEGRKLLDHVSFSLKKGQILGIAGVEGNGQNELAEAIFGFYSGVKGSILFDGKEILGKSIRAIRDDGISYIPEDRIKTGAAGNISLWGNMIADIIDSPLLKKHGLLNYKNIHERADKLISDFGVLCQNDDQPIGMLSGGNMQKVVVAREFSSDPKLLIANQPTRGIDVGANEFIWKKIIEQRDAGKGVILISADLNEIMELSDSILVMCGGQAAAYFEDAKKVDEFELGNYMLGLKHQEVSES